MSRTPVNYANFGVWAHEHFYVSVKQAECLLWEYRPFSLDFQSIHDHKNVSKQALISLGHI